MPFTLRTGQKPLPGYTIKRGIGHGGFGEVYFAVSDAGKEVALKCLRNHQEIELRGISQCLNLKHPGLVHLYDLRVDGDGNSWLIMEYVAGDPLSAILPRYPNGVDTDLACTWFQGLASAVHYLHDHGIVHRDLKPANIFLEHGTIKVGDYGLCKVLGSSQRGGQTQGIGTVHYMAPEISSGTYNRQIDIYAAGVILYEMLTGAVPFTGESPGEVLMKHLTASPDLTRIATPLLPILEKSLCKNPALRYANIAEVSRDVAHVTDPKDDGALSRPTQVSAGRDTSAAPALALSRKGVYDLGVSLLMAALFSLIFAFAWGLVYEGSFDKIVPSLLMSVACSWSVLVAGSFWLEPLEDSATRRLIFMGVGMALGVFAFWLEGHSFTPAGNGGASERAVARAAPDEPIRGPRMIFAWPYGTSQRVPLMTGYAGYFGLMFLVLRWWKLTMPSRRARFDFDTLFGVGFWAYLLLFLLPVEDRPEAFAAELAAAVIAQLVSPWQPPPPEPVKRRRFRAV